MANDTPWDDEKLSFEEAALCCRISEEQLSLYCLRGVIKAVQPPHGNTIGTGRHFAAEDVRKLADRLTQYAVDIIMFGPLESEGKHDDS